MAMPDLTYQCMTQCQQMGNGRGKVFFVSSERVASTSYEVSLFSPETPDNCNCLAAVTNKGGRFRDENDNAICKHVKWVMSHVCTWSQLAGPEPCSDDGKCPRCNGPVINVRVAV